MYTERVPPIRPYPTQQHYSLTVVRHRNFHFTLLRLQRNAFANKVVSVRCVAIAIPHRADVTVAIYQASTDRKKRTAWRGSLRTALVSPPIWSHACVHKMPRSVFVARHFASDLLLWTHSLAKFKNLYIIIQSRGTLNNNNLLQFRVFRTIVRLITGAENGSVTIFIKQCVINIRCECLVKITICPSITYESGNPKVLASKQCLKNFKQKALRWRCIFATTKTATQTLCKFYNFFYFTA